MRHERISRMHPPSRNLGIEDRPLDSRPRQVAVELVLHLECLIPPIHQFSRIIQVSNFGSWHSHNEIIRDQLGPRSWIISLGVYPLKVGCFAEHKHRRPYRPGNRHVEFAEF